MGRRRKGENRTAQTQRRREALFERQGGKCFYCGCEMVLPNTERRRKKGGRVKGEPPNLATYEHRHGKLNPERGKHPGEFINVVACLKCNNEKAREDERRLKQTFPEELWRRNGAWPLGWQYI